MRGLSLRTKVFFLFAGAALLIVVPPLVLIQRAVEEGIYERADHDLAFASDTALPDNWSKRDSLLLLEAYRRTTATGLEKAWTAGDSKAIGRILRRGLDDGRPVFAADTNGLLLAGPQVSAEVLRRAQGSAEGLIAFLDEQGTPTQIALWPVVTDSGVVGVAGVGTRLGAGTVKDLQPNLGVGINIALVVGDSIVATTFPDTVAPRLASRRLSAVQGAGRPLRCDPAALRPAGSGRCDLYGRPYLAATRRLATEGVPASVLLFRPIAGELVVARGIVSSMVGIGAIAVVMALVLALAVARIVARPAQALAEASERLARGDYRAPLPRVSGDEIGQLARAFGEMREAIAEREDRLRSAQAEMIHREKLAAMGRLVAQLSHEINNPIYNIQNCLEALERRGDPADPNREFLELAQEELARMAKLTRQLLDQSRPLSDAVRPLSINGVVHRVLTLAADEMEGRGIGVVTELDPALPPVVAHPEAIQQVLANLVANAADAMDGGGTLRVQSRADAGAVEVVVEDTGTGIAPEHLPHIFEAFYTTKPGVQGIGLGLFVSEGIVRGHRGSLSVESRPGEGSRFTVRLPRETLRETPGGVPLLPEPGQAAAV